MERINLVTGRKPYFVSVSVIKNEHIDLAIKSEQILSDFSARFLINYSLVKYTIPPPKKVLQYAEYG